MKVLTLANGTKLNVSDYSQFSDIVAVFGSRGEAGSFWNNFTEQTLTDAYLGDEKFSAIPVSMSAEIDEVNGNITAHYHMHVTDPVPRFEETPGFPVPELTEEA